MVIGTKPRIATGRFHDKKSQVGTRSALPFGTFSSTHLPFMPKNSSEMLYASLCKASQNQTLSSSRRRPLDLSSIELAGPGCCKGRFSLRPSGQFDTSCVREKRSQPSEHPTSFAKNVYYTEMYSDRCQQMCQQMCQQISAMHPVFVLPRMWVSLPSCLAVVVTSDQASVSVESNLLS